jgi:hypothetical protein
LFSGRNESKEAHVREARLLVRGGEVGDAARGVVGDGPAEVLLAHLLARYALYDVGARDEHVARPLDHKDEVVIAGE